MVEVYAEPFAKRHYAGRFSAAYCFPFFVGIAFLVVAFTIAFSTGQLWIKSHTFFHQPEVHFTYEMLLVLETDVPGEERVWSNLEEVNDLFYDKQIAVTAQASEEDLNHDGKVDIIDVRVRAMGLRPVHGVKLLLGFNYKIQGYADMEMRTLGYVQHASPLPGAKLYVDGDLRLQQREAIEEGLTESTHSGDAGSPFAALLVGDTAATSGGLASIQLQGVFNLYLFRNHTTFYDCRYPVWQAGNGESFEVEARVRIPSHEEILYRPNRLTVAKFGWVQLFAILYPLFWLLYQFQWVVFHYRILETRVVSDVTPKSHKF